MSNRLHELLEKAGDEPEVVPEGEYVVRVERVEVVKKDFAIRPVCKVVGGEENGKLVCIGMYDFSAERRGSRSTPRAATSRRSASCSSAGPGVCTCECSTVASAR